MGHRPEALELKTSLGLRSASVFSLRSMVCIFLKDSEKAKRCHIHLSMIVHDCP
jgi:hypothetical protein